MYSEPSEDVDELAHEVIGAAIAVHRHLGPGFLERIYENALAHELELREFEFRQQQEFAVHYKTEHVGAGRYDFLVGDQLLVELKAVEETAAIHKAQTKSYLKALELELGLLLNFGAPVLKDGITRVVHTET